MLISVLWKFEEYTGVIVSSISEQCSGAETPTRESGLNGYVAMLVVLELLLASRYWLRTKRSARLTGSTAGT